MQDIDSLIEFVLRNSDRIKKCVEIKRIEKSGTGGHTEGGAPSKNKISDPTAMQAIMRVEPIFYIYCPYGAYINGRRDERYIRCPEKWLEVEEKTKRHYTADRGTIEEKNRQKIKEIYKRRYLMGEYGEKWDKTCGDLNISHGFYYAVVHDIVRFAGLYAAGIGLINPYGRF